MKKFTFVFIFLLCIQCSIAYAGDYNIYECSQDAEKWASFMSEYSAKTGLAEVPFSESSNFNNAIADTFIQSCLGASEDLGDSLQSTLVSVRDALLEEYGIVFQSDAKEPFFKSYHQPEWLDYVVNTFDSTSGGVASGFIELPYDFYDTRWHDHYTFHNLIDTPSWFALTSDGYVVVCSYADFVSETQLSYPSQGSGGYHYYLDQAYYSNNNFLGYYKYFNKLSIFFPDLSASFTDVNEAITAFYGSSQDPIRYNNIVTNNNAPSTITPYSANRTYKNNDTIQKVVNNYNNPSFDNDSDPYNNNIYVNYNYKNEDIPYYGNTSVYDLELPSAEDISFNLTIADYDSDVIEDLSYSVNSFWITCLTVPLVILCLGVLL